MNNAFNVNSKETINTIKTVPPNGAEGVSLEVKKFYEIIVSRLTYAVPNLSSSTSKAAIIDVDALTLDVPDIDSLGAVLEDGTPTGTITTTAGSATIAGITTQFTTELEVGQWVYVPNNDEFIRVKSIESNTSFTAYEAVSQSFEGQAFDVYSMYIGATSGLADFPTPTLEKIEASSEAVAAPETFTEISFSFDGLQVENLNGATPQHYRLTLSYIVTGENVATLSELQDYFFHLDGDLPSKQLAIVDELSA